MAYWGQKEDLIPQILVDYGNRYGTPQTASYFVEGKPQTVIVPAEFSGSGRTSQTFLVRVCQDFYNESSVQQNPDFGPFGGQFLGPYMMTQPYFCSTTSKDGLSGFGPIEAWYLDIKNNTGADGYISYTLYMQYIDKDGNFASASVTYPNTVRILTQTYPMNVQPLRRVAGVQPWIVTPIQKYSGNVTPYPYKDLPVNYRITTNAAFGGLYHITGSAAVDTNIGSGFNTIAGTINIASFNIPELEAASGQLNPISINSVIPKPIYKLTNCSSSLGITASLDTYNFYDTNASLLLSSSAISGCFYVNSITTSITPTYTNLSVLNAYSSCFDCEWTSSILPIDYIVVGGGGGGGYYAGGGAGGVITGSLSVTSSNYSIVIGGGGIGSIGTTGGTNGGLSSINTPVFGIQSALGGGYGAWYNGGGLQGGNAGGSGGGGNSAFLGGQKQTAGGGSGTAGQGFAGANVSCCPGYNGGGGGGAGAAAVLYNGGNGIQWLNGNYYGGGGAAADTGGGCGSPGLGGGGACGQPGTANTGGGAGGFCCPANGAGGGSGVAIIRYPGGRKGTGGSISFSNGYTYHTFTNNGTFSY